MTYEDKANKLRLIKERAAAATDLADLKEALLNLVQIAVDETNEDISMLDGEFPPSAAITAPSD